MDKSKLLLFTGLVLSLYGAINTVFVIMLTFGVSQTDPAYLGLWETGGFLIIYAIIQGLIPLLSGLAGLFWRQNEKRVKLVMVCAWALIIDAFGLFFTSYGQSWSVVLFDLGIVIVSVIYFYAAQKNLKLMGGWKAKLS